MVEQNNASISWAESLNSLVIRYFKENLSSFILKRETAHGPHWGVTFANENVEVRIGGDVGFSVNVIIDKTEFHLWQYDRSVNNAMDTTEKNILFQLDILKKFLTEER